MKSHVKKKNYKASCHAKQIAGWVTDDQGRWYENWRGCSVWFDVRHL